MQLCVHVSVSVHTHTSVCECTGGSVFVACMSVCGPSPKPRNKREAPPVLTEKGNKFTQDAMGLHSSS